MLPLKTYVHNFCGSSLWSLQDVSPHGKFCHCAKQLKRLLSVLLSAPFLEFSSVSLLSCWWLFFIFLFTKINISLSCVLVIYTYTSSFYLTCFFLPEISLFFLFFLFSLNICTTSSYFSSVLSLIFPCFLSSSPLHWSTWFVESSSF